MPTDGAPNCAGEAALVGGVLVGIANEPIGEGSGWFAMKNGGGMPSILNNGIVRKPSDTLTRRVRLLWYGSE